MPNKALLMGINDYKTASRLRGCVNDVEGLRELLPELGFDEENIRVLVDSEVVKDRLLRETEWLFSDAGENDRLIFHFSGHGSYLPDTSGDEDLDELLCLYDMDWNDPNSYLIDDDLSDLLGRLPKGAILNVFLDSCHSGTGTRSFEVGRRDAVFGRNPLVDIKCTLERAEKLSDALPHKSMADLGHELEKTMRTQRDRQDAVLARFLLPPAYIEAKMPRSPKVKALFQDVRRAELNHVLWTGCKDNQTSADAYIDGDYHGAFSYYLCQLLSEGGEDAQRQDLIRDLQNKLRDESFSQIPQLEPAAIAGSFFDRVDALPLRPATDAPHTELEAQTQMVAAIKELTQAVRDMGAGRALAEARAATKQLVYVHGISRHEAGFSNGWWQAMSPHTPSLLPGTLGGNRHEVLWSDIVNRDLARAASPSLEEAAMAEQIRGILRDRLERAIEEAQTESSVDTRSVDSAEMERGLTAIPGFGSIDDFVRYMFNADERRQIINRFRQVVVPLLEQGRQMEIIAHSWGTVVAYEAMREMDSETSLHGGAVRNFFTVGGALAISPVRSNLFGRVQDGRLPVVVRRWINLDARGDIVGGRLSNHFAVNPEDEHLNLPAVGCGSFLGIVSPSCAHGSYFVTENVRVNQGIFGAYIEA